MNKLPLEKRAAIVRALVEGTSVRGTARMIGVSKDTVLKLLVEVGDFCSIYQDHRLRDLNTARVEADEIWAFVGAKQKNATRQGDGDIWTFTAIDADSKLMISWLVGQRNSDSANPFMADVAMRLKNRVQLTTDGHNMYIEAVRKAFTFGRVDFARLAKSYATPLDAAGAHRRYSPPVCTGAVKERRVGRPDMDLVSTSFVERANLTMRMGMRRFTRLTNAFSKKMENHAHSVALHFMFYNFCRSHATLTKAAKGIHTSPAMASGLTDHVWKVEEILAMMDGTTLVGE
ncbi:MAG: IS1 family transposase [Acetobacteraceae bacterium]